MTQDDAAGKVLLEMLEQHIIEEKDAKTVYSYLYQLWGVGWEEGRHLRGKRRSVTQYNKDGTVVKIHPTILSAANKMNLDVATIGRALSGKFKYAGGYRWEYTDKTKPTSEQKIGSVKSKSIQQGQESHVSKTFPLSQ